MGEQSLGRGYLPESGGVTVLTQVEGASVKLELSDGTIGIRRFQMEDATALLEAIRESVEEICAWMVWCHPDYGWEDSVRFIARCPPDWQQGKQYSFVIEDQCEGGFLGSVGLRRVEPGGKIANLGYWVRTRRTRRGVATAAVKLAIRFAFERLDIDRVEMVVATDNVPSLRVAEKAGGRFTALAKANLNLGGKSHPAAIYTVVRPAANALNTETGAGPQPFAPAT